eukprot:gene4801-98_t
MAVETKVDHVSWVGDVSYGFGIFAFVFCAVGIFTPAWVDQRLDVIKTVEELNLNLTLFGDTNRIIGRGFIQAYEYNGYGVITLIPYFLSDSKGSLDPFCGKNATTSSFPILQDFAEFGPSNQTHRGRSYRAGDWCTKRETAFAFCMIALILGLCAVFATAAAQKGWCGQTPFIILVVLVFLFSLIGTSIMGAFINEEQSRVNNKELEQRFFPFSQDIVPGYSFGLYILGMIVYGAALVLAIFERFCCRKAHQKTLKGNPHASKA